MFALVFILCGLLGNAYAEELVLWHAYRGAERQALDSLIADHNALHPSRAVTARAVPYDGFNSKLEAAIPRGNGPDLFIAAHERLGSWVPSGLIAPNPSPLEDTFPIVEQALFHDESVYGTPLAYKTLALFINSDRIGQAPATTADLIELAEQERVQGRIGLAYQATEPYFHAPWAHGFDGALLQDDGVVLNRPGAIKALAFAQSLMGSGLLPEEPTGALVTQLFNDGMTSMAINGPWFLGEIDPKINFRVVPLPTVSETGLAAAPYLTVEAVQISAHSANPTEAWAFAQWLMSTESAIERAVHGRQSVATQSAYRDERVANDPILAAFRMQLERSHPMPTQPLMTATWEPLARAIRGVMRGATEPAAALEAAQSEFEAISRPPPPPSNPVPYLIAFAALLLGGTGWLARRIWASRAAIRAHRHAYQWVGPASAAMALLVIVPFVVGAAVSLFSHREGQWTFVGLSHFIDILFARDWPVTSALSFWFTLVVTVGWTAANIVLHVSIGVALAMLLRAPWLRMKSVYRVLLILPWAIPNYITALIWKGMFHRQFGAINGLLEWVGMEPVSWFSQFSTAFAANLITNTWLGFPFMMVVTLGALQSIPGNVEEAASLDGANAWQRFAHVTWPMLRPALLPAVILGSIWTFNMFNIIYLVSAGEPDGGTEILISEAYRWAFTRGHRYGYAAAYAVLIFGVLLVYSRGTDRILSRRAA